MSGYELKPVPNYGGPGLAPMVIGCTVYLKSEDEDQPSSASALPRSNAIKLAKAWQENYPDSVVWVEDAKGRRVWPDEEAADRG